MKRVGVAISATEKKNARVGSGLQPNRTPLSYSIRGNSRGGAPLLHRKNSTSRVYEKQQERRGNHDGGGAAGNNKDEGVSPAQKFLSAQPKEYFSLQFLAPCDQEQQGKDLLHDDRALTKESLMDDTATASTVAAVEEIVVDSADVDASATVEGIHPSQKAECSPLLHDSAVVRARLHNLTSESRARSRKNRLILDETARLCEELEDLLWLATNVKPVREAAHACDTHGIDL